MFCRSMSCWGCILWGLMRLGLGLVLMFVTVSSSFFLVIIILCGLEFVGFENGLLWELTFFF